MEELTEKIERYLNGLMTEQEQAAFELEMADDTSLREEVKLQRKTAELLEAAAFEETRQQVQALNSNRRGIFVGPVVKIAAAACVILGLGLGYYLISNQYSDAALYAAYAEPYPDRITTMSTDMSPATTALRYYNEENYAEAATAFRALADSGLYEERFTIYEAVSLTNSGKADQAIELLKKHIETEPSDKTACEWELVLALLSAEEGEKAEAQLVAFLQHNEGYQNKKAEELLEALQSVWR